MGLTVVLFCFIVAIASVLLARAPDCAAQVPLAWNPSEDPNVAGYNVYYGTVSGDYTATVNAGYTTTYIVSNLQAGSIYYFAVTAYDSYGNESNYSNEVSATAPYAFTVISSVANGTGGTVTPSAAIVGPGGGVTLTVVPSTGYSLVSLTDNGTDVTTALSSGSYTIANMTANHAVVATFAIDTYIVTAVESGSGSITDSGGSVSYGGSVTFTMTPASGYTLSGLTDDGVAVSPTQGPSGTFTYTNADVTANQTVDATFAPVAAAVPAVGSLGFIGAACGMLWLAMKRRRS
jgi:hypothetical protein